VLNRRFAQEPVQLLAFLRFVVRGHETFLPLLLEFESDHVLVKLGAPFV